MRQLLLGRIVAAALLLPAPLLGQDRVIPDLLAAARARLNDLRYQEADSIVQAVLDFPNLRRSDRVQAWQLSAGARFPEQEDAQDRTGAVAALRQLIRLAPNTPLPREVAWPGLDSLLRQVRRQTFGAAATPRPSNALTGPDERGTIDVVASRPAIFSLGARDANGQFVRLDSIGPVEQGALRFSILRDMRQLLRSGNVELTVLAIDPEWNDTITLRYDAVVDAPPLDLLIPPPPFDSSRLLPEITKPKRLGGIVGGIVVGVGTVVAAQVLREGPFRRAVPRDGRAIGLGVSLGVITGGGVWLLDRGAPIKKNIEANGAALAEHERAVAGSRAENERRIANYRGELRINPEPKP